MDPKDISQLIEGISKRLPKALLENKTIEEVIFAIGHVASYLESEQQKRMQLNMNMKEHQEQMKQFDKVLWGDKNDIDKYPGLVHEWSQSRKQSEKNSKLISVVLAAVVVSFVLALMQVLGFHV